jgi:hypothetical protein
VFLFCFCLFFTTSKEMIFLLCCENRLGGCRSRIQIKPRAWGGLKNGFPYSTKIIHLKLRLRSSKKKIQYNTIQQHTRVVFVLHLTNFLIGAPFLHFSITRSERREWCVLPDLMRANRTPAPVDPRTDWGEWGVGAGRMGFSCHVILVADLCYRDNPPCCDGGNEGCDTSWGRAWGEE